MHRLAIDIHCVDEEAAKVASDRAGKDDEEDDAEDSTR